MRSVVHFLPACAGSALMFLASVFVLQAEIIRFNGPASVPEGDTVELSWEIHGAGRVSIEGVAGSLPAMGSLKVVPLITTTYTLRVSLSGDSLKATHTVTVIPRVHTDDLKQVTIVERSREQSRYLSGILPLDSVAKGEKFYYEIVGYDRTGYPEKVTLFVTVQDRFGNFITGLANSASGSTVHTFFRSLTETMNGRQTAVKDFGIREVHDSVSTPHAFSLVLDYSGSMAEHISDLETSSLGFINAKEDKDEIAIVKFASFVSREVPLEQSRDVLRERFKRTGLTEELGDRTALYAGADEGLNAMDSLDNTDRKRALVLFTDGHDNASISRAVDGGYAFTPRELIIKALKTNTSVYTIGFADADSTFLASVAMLTGGRYFYARNGNEISAIYSSLPRMFRNRYEISFRPMMGAGLHMVELTADNHHDSTATAHTTMFLGRPDSLPRLPTMSSEAQSVAHFESGKAVADVNQPLVRKIAEYMKTDPEARVVIRGHTDSRGDANKNKVLSKQRAESVAGTLTKFGIPKNRIQTLGIGEDELLWSPDNEEWQARENRRVDIIVKN